MKSGRNTDSFRSWQQAMRSVAVMVLATMVLALSSPAFAALGEDETSVVTDQVHMQAALRAVPARMFTVEELQTPSGITVREYVSQERKVFAVAWQGPWFPDLREMLGAYFGQYEEAASQNTRRGFGPLLIRADKLVVQVGGHTRAFVGRAYLPDLLPEGVQSDEIR